MKTYTVELPYDPTSQNVWDRLNRFAKPRETIRWRDAIILAIGEGPWRKLYPSKKIPSRIREQVTGELRSRWPKKRKVVIETIIRRPRRFDDGNSDGGLKPVYDGLQWAGWLVSDHCKWLRRVCRDQVIGDAKTIIQLYVPESDKEEVELEARFS